MGENTMAKVKDDCLCGAISYESDTDPVVRLPVIAKTVRNTPVPLLACTFGYLEPA